MGSEMCIRDRLLDDNLFDLWINETVELEDVLGKAHDPDALARRIATARRQMMDLEDPMLDDEEDSEEDDLE